MPLLHQPGSTQTRVQLVALMLLQGVGVGLLSSAVGAGYGLWRHGPGLPGAVKGMNTVGMIVCLLSAWIMYGADLSNRAEVGMHARLGDHQRVRMTRFPLHTPLVVLLGGVICQGLMLLLRTRL